MSINSKEESLEAFIPFLMSLQEKQGMDVINRYKTKIIQNVFAFTSKDVNRLYFGFRQYLGKSKQGI